jgi:hypothetical protein
MGKIVLGSKVKFFFRFPKKKQNLEREKNQQNHRKLMLPVWEQPYKLPKPVNDIACCGV